MIVERTDLTGNSIYNNNTLMFKYYIDCVKNGLKFLCVLKTCLQMAALFEVDLFKFFKVC